MKTLIINSKEDKALYKVLSAVKKTTDEYDLSDNLDYLIEFIIEEVFTNIVTHGYKNEEGIVKIRYEVLDNPLRLHLIFIDDAFMFNPLETVDPNLSDNIDERIEGSMGIYLVKRYADELEYDRIDNQNVFSIVKIMEGE